MLRSGPEAVRYIVNHAAVRAIFCDTKTLNIVSTEYGLRFWASKATSYDGK